MNRKRELQQTISRLVATAFEQGEQAARDGIDRRDSPYEPHNPMLAQVWRIGHMEAIAQMHWRQVELA